MKADEESSHKGTSTLSVIPPGPSNGELVTQAHPDTGKEMVDRSEGVYSNVLPHNTAIPVKDLASYLLQHAGGSFLQDQFQSVPMANSYSQKQGLLLRNAKKNRYKNIVPYDHSRVLLQENSEKKWEDYINASFVKGYGGKDTFIAAQGPNNQTLPDFVRMLWEQRVDRVVMLTNLVELRKIKCAQYWPADDTQTVGEIEMKLLTTRVFAQYTVRQISLLKKDESPRTVTQFHFTAWPDKEVPDSPWGLVDLHQRVHDAPGSGPLLVHCSAGVGRTGTFIALSHLLQEAEETGKMDFLAALWSLRQDRMSMIQTLDQFRFLHQAALIGHTASGTSFAARDLHLRLAALEEEDGFEREFQALARITEECTVREGQSPDANTDAVYENGQAVMNHQKNRCYDVLPKSKYTPTLTCETKAMGDYINAVLVPTLSKDRQDILTQLPLPSTVTDFWRLVTQYHVGLVVALETDAKHTDKTIGEFLPQSDTTPLYDTLFEVRSKTKEKCQLWQEISLTVSKNKKTILGNTGEQHHVTCLLCQDTDLDPETVLECLRKVKACESGKETRTLYMCRNGAAHCGFLSVQSLLLDRLEVDQCFTVPLMVGAVRAIRPQIIPSLVSNYSLSGKQLFPLW
ncbi:hypothetical protein EGW08_013206 [Elysia chlorotica]|uniref:protein-tyrosine-phosphatase n=1 Tax=Elysia chlorotica TaxID=188477 RepID=A0A3S0ZHJ5_ELYCH|nr:hypothetical protein EGW08_013206 [Elysia chlorotica]